MVKCFCQKSAAGPVRFVCSSRRKFSDLKWIWLLRLTGADSKIYNQNVCLWFASEEAKRRCNAEIAGFASLTNCKISFKDLLWYSNFFDPTSNLYYSCCIYTRSELETQRIRCRDLPVAPHRPKATSCRNMVGKPCPRRSRTERKLATSRNSERNWTS